MFSHALAISCPHEISTANVSHVVKPHLVVKFISQQCRVLLHKVNIVINNGEIVPTQGIDMCRDWHIKELIGCGAILRCGYNSCNYRHCHK